MIIEYTGRQTSVTAKLKAQAEAGLSRIEKIVSDLVSAHVICTVDKYRHTAELTIKGRAAEYVARCESTDMETALHDALAKVEQQIVRHKDKRTAGMRHPKTDLKTADAVDAGGEAAAGV